MRHFFVLCCALLAMPWIAVAAGSDSRPVLTIINWEEFIDPDLLRVFEKREKVRIQQVYFSTVEESVELARQHAGKADLVVGGMVVTERLKTENRLEKLQHSKLPNVRAALPQFQLDGDYAVPYLWGYTGFAWRPDKVKQAPRNYPELLALARAHPGKVGLTDDGMEFAHAVMYMYGKPPYAVEDLAQLKAALAKYKAEGEKLFRIHVSVYDDTNPFLTGELVAGQVYNGDIVWLVKDRKQKMGYANPEPGCYFWEENFMLLARAPQPGLAYKFLNYLNDAKIAARNAESVYYASGNQLAVNYYSDAFLRDPLILPKLENTVRCRVNKPARDPAVQKFYDELKPTGVNRH